MSYPIPIIIQHGGYGPVPAWVILVAGVLVVAIIATITVALFWDGTLTWREDWPVLLLTTIVFAATGGCGIFAIIAAIIHWGKTL
jgi:hypothetical protein